MDMITVHMRHHSAIVSGLHGITMSPHSYTYNAVPAGMRSHERMIYNQIHDVQPRCADETTYALDVMVMELRLRNLWDAGDSVGMNDKSHPRNLPFGGFDIYLFGDFKQLPPVLARPMYRDIRNIDKVDAKNKRTIELIKHGFEAYRDIRDDTSLERQ